MSFRSLLSHQTTESTLPLKGPLQPLESGYKSLTLESTVMKLLTLPSTHRYELSVRQQPLAARAHGFGERYRRMIDPPPIVQLTLIDFDPTSDLDASELRYPFNVVHCTLVSPNSSETDVTAITDPCTQRTSRYLMGTLVASPFISSDPEFQLTASVKGPNASNCISCFFVFPDLSCCTPGYYKLHFGLVHLDSEVTPLGEREIVSCVTSNVFQVFSARDFPGIRASTPLTRGLKKMGVMVRVKRRDERHDRSFRDSEGQGKVGESEDSQRDKGSGDSPERQGRKRKEMVTPIYNLNRRGTATLWSQDPPRSICTQVWHLNFGHSVSVMKVAVHHLGAKNTFVITVAFIYCESRRVPQTQRDVSAVVIGGSCPEIL